MTNEKDRRIAALETLLAECLDYLKNEYDVVDGSYGEHSPNKAMQLGQEINETLNGRHFK